MSKGQKVAHPVNGKWYWLDSKETDKEGVYVFDKAGSSAAVFRFVHVRSGRERFVSRLNSSVQMRNYVAVGEAIRYVCAHQMAPRQTVCPHSFGIVLVVPGSSVERKKLS